MIYRIQHATTYSYGESVPVCHNVVMLAPRGGPRVQCEQQRLSVHPRPRYIERRHDYFGNIVHRFSVEEKHSRLRVTSSVRVRVLPQSIVPAQESPPWEEVRDAVRDRRDTDWFLACQFVFDSPRVRHSEDFASYARHAFAAGRPMVAAALDLNSRLHRDMKYDLDATDTNTRAEDAFAGRHGVCQDFTHIEIACLRSLGIPARYVSGYIRTLPPAGKPRLVGADQSHAWVEAYLGNGLWLELDPTNNGPCTIDHIPIAWGRDYSDVVPIKGVFVGGVGHQLQVSVDVAPAEDS